MNTTNHESRKEKFIKETPKGTPFAFSNDITGEHHADGTVFFNTHGVTYRHFDSIEDFADYYFLNKEVAHNASYNVGERNENGEISWHVAPFDLDEIDGNEDGDVVYTKPVPVMY
jgi:hypothetical protein